MQDAHFVLADGRKIAVPRAAVWIGEAAGALWAGLEKIGETRAQRALREVAARFDATDPQLAARMRAGLRSGPVRG